MSAALYPDAAAAADAGAEDYMTKPMANDNFLWHVHALLQAHDTARDAGTRSTMDLVAGPPREWSERTPTGTGCYVDRARASVGESLTGT